MIDKNDVSQNILKQNNINQIKNKAIRTHCKTVDGIPNTASSPNVILIKNNPRFLKKIT